MRADKFFAERFSSRTKAAEKIERGEILVNGKKIKPSDEVSEEDDVEFLTPIESYVSNGGYKLSRAVRAFGFDCEDKIFADIGASTGGFTDCLLQNGAKKVYCVDVGESLLDEKLRSDSRIVRMENTNARSLTAKSFSEVLDGAVVDVSFISLRLILPVLFAILPENGVVLALIKPQFECEDKRLLSKRGLVLDGKTRKKIVEKIYDACLENGLYPLDVINAPLKEKKNVEYVIYLKKNAVKYADRNMISEKSMRLV